MPPAWPRSNDACMHFSSFFLFWKRLHHNFSRGCAAFWVQFWSIFVNLGSVLVLYPLQRRPAAPKISSGAPLGPPGAVFDWFWSIVVDLDRFWLSFGSFWLSFVDFDRFWIGFGSISIDSTWTFDVLGSRDGQIVDGGALEHQKFRQKVDFTR